MFNINKFSEDYYDFRKEIKRISEVISAVQKEHGLSDRDFDWDNSSFVIMSHYVRFHTSSASQLHNSYYDIPKFLFGLSDTVIKKLVTEDVERKALKAKNAELKEEVAKLKGQILEQQVGKVESDAWKSYSGSVSSVPLRSNVPLHNVVNTATARQEILDSLGLKFE